jgi:hypothetical protein
MTTVDPTAASLPACPRTCRPFLLNTKRDPSLLGSLDSFSLRSLRLLLTLPLLLLAILPLAGCKSSFATYYVPQTLDAQPSPLSKGSEAVVMKIGSQDVQEVRQRLYPTAKIVGSSQYIGADSDVALLRTFAGSVGADLVLWKQVLVSEIQRTDVTMYPRTDTSTVTTNVNGTRTQQQVITRSNDYVPYTTTESRYQHEALFLRTGP